MILFVTAGSFLAARRSETPRAVWLAYGIGVAAAIVLFPLLRLLPREFVSLRMTTTQYNVYSIGVLGFALLALLAVPVVLFAIHKRAYSVMGTVGLFEIVGFVWLSITTVMVTYPGLSRL